MDMNTFKKIQMNVNSKHSTKAELHDMKIYITPEISDSKLPDNYKIRFGFSVVPYLGIIAWLLIGMLIINSPYGPIIDILVLWQIYKIIKNSIGLGVMEYKFESNGDHILKINNKIIKGDKDTIYFIIPIDGGYLFSNNIINGKMEGPLIKLRERGINIGLIFKSFDYVLQKFIDKVKSTGQYFRCVNINSVAADQATVSVFIVNNSETEADETKKKTCNLNERDAYVKNTTLDTLREIWHSIPLGVLKGIFLLFMVQFLNLLPLINNLPQWNNLIWYGKKTLIVLAVISTYFALAEVEE